MATGSSSGRANSGSKSSFNFAADDILCSYDDFANQESFHGSHADPPIPANAIKDFHKNKLVRPVTYAPPSCSQPEDSLIQDLVSTVEKSMKRNADSIMRFLEGISSRLSQLELYCYNLDKSIGEMRSELTRDHDEADAKLKSLETHVQEVHRSVQILRDKQELAETQKELAKLHFVRKDSSSSSQSQTNEEKSPTSDIKKTECMSDASNQQLALALPHQILPQPQLQPQPPPQLQPPPLTSQAPPQNVSQPHSYYLPPLQMQTMAAPTQMTRTQYLPSDPQYCARQSPQLQNVSSVPAQPMQPQVHQTLPPQSFSHYQQQWSQPLPQQAPVPPQQQSSAQAPPSTVYPPCPTSQPTTLAPKEAPPSSVHMPVQYSGIPATASGRPENMTIGYGGPGRTIQQQQQQQQPPPQAIRSTFIMQNNDGFGVVGPNPSMSPGNAFMVYDGEGGRVQHVLQQSPLPQGAYPQTNVSYQNPQPTPTPNHVQNLAYPQFIRKHANNELVDRLVNMGFRVDHVLSVIQRMAESGQPVDFNSVIDRLSVPPSGNPQRAWSG